MWRSFKTPLICQSGRNSEIRRREGAGAQVRRHEDARCSPRAAGEEVKETAMAVRDRGGRGGKKKEKKKVFRLQAGEGGGCGEGNRLLLEKAGHERGRWKRG